MGEKKEFITSLAIMFIVICASFIWINIDDYIPRGYIIEKYDASFTNSGLLYENYTYRIFANKKYHMLYRKWESPLHYGYSTGARIVLLNVTLSDESIDYIPYIKDDAGIVQILNNSSASSSHIQYIEENAEKNEAGIYVPAGIPKGVYTVKYVFRIVPKLQYDGHHYMLRLILASEHPKYERVEVKFPNNFVVYSLPYLRETNKNIFEGKVREGFKIKFWVIFTNTEGFSEFYVDNVDRNLLSVASEESFWESVSYWGGWSVAHIPIFLIIIIPFIYTILYVLWGREKKYEVSEDVTLPPAERPPLIVNFVFKNEGNHLDYGDLLISTLLYLHKKGYIYISKDGKSVKILKTDSYEELDEYSKRVLRYIHEMAEGEVLDLDNLKNKITNARKSRNYEDLEEVRILSRYLWIEGKELDKISSKYMKMPPKFVEYLLIFGVFYIFICFLTAFIFTDYAIYSLQALLLVFLYEVQAGLMWWHPEVLGKWKKDYYRERLKWDKFREFLSDEDRIKEVASIYSSVLDDWLIYGYALGVGRNLKKNS